MLRTTGIVAKPKGGFDGTRPPTGLEGNLHLESTEDTLDVAPPPSKILRTSGYTSNGSGANSYACEFCRYAASLRLG